MMTAPSIHRRGFSVNVFLPSGLLCLPILGYSLFETAETAAAGSTPSDSGSVTLYLRAKGIEATGAGTAAGVMLGRPANGQVEWRAADARTLKDIKDVRLSEKARRSSIAGKAMPLTTP